MLLYLDTALCSAVLYCAGTVFGSLSEYQKSTVLSFTKPCASLRKELSDLYRQHEEMRRRIFC